MGTTGAKPKPILESRLAGGSPPFNSNNEARDRLGWIGMKKLLSMILLSTIALGQTPSGRHGRAPSGRGFAPVEDGLSALSNEILRSIRTNEVPGLLPILKYTNNSENILFNVGQEAAALPETDSNRLPLIQFVNAATVPIGSLAREVHNGEAPDFIKQIYRDRMDPLKQAFGTNNWQKVAETMDLAQAAVKESQLGDRGQATAQLDKTATGYIGAGHGRAFLAGLRDGANLADSSARNLLAQRAERAMQLKNGEKATQPGDQEILSALKNLEARHKKFSDALRNGDMATLKTFAEDMPRYLQTLRKEADTDPRSPQAKDLAFIEKHLGKEMVESLANSQTTSSVEKLMDEFKKPEPSAGSENNPNDMSPSSSAAAPAI